MWFLLSLVWKTTLSFSRIIITSVMTAILSAVWISVVWIPIDTAVCAIMSAHLSARQFYFTLLNFVIHLFSPPFLLNCFNFILLNFNPVVLLFLDIYISISLWFINKSTTLQLLNGRFIRLSFQINVHIKFENALNFCQRGIFIWYVVRYFFYYMNKIREFNLSVFIA